LGALRPNQLFDNNNYKNRFFESPPTAGFKKTDFGISSAEGAGNAKIGFILRIADSTF
jgi:hypothetical protein